MIDLTDMINNAFTSIDRFDVQLWNDALNKFVTDQTLTFIWNEDEDLWINIAQGGDKVVMVSREFPFLFVDEKFDRYLDLTGYYNDDFIKVVITNWEGEYYKINIDRLVKGRINWHSSVVDPNGFSINDLFYATH